MIHRTNKVRKLLDAQVVATATATGYPTFPAGPTAGKMLFAGDFMGADITGFEWELANLTTFTLADLTIEHSDDGSDWTTLAVFPQLGANGVKRVTLYETDPKPLRFLRALVDMTGTPGTSTHTVKVFFDQVGPRGAYAPPGMTDRHTG